MNPHRHGSVVAARAAFTLATLAVALLAACQARPGTAGTQVAPVGRETVITDSQIVAMGVQTAWDAVRLRAPRLTFGTDASGQPTNVRLEPRMSVNADQTPLLVVDGARVSDIMYLQEIPASDVRSIRILGSQEASALYGLQGFGGAIVVKTKGGR